jgi:hypothetical protein
MSIQKKSLISSLKTTKKANVASSPAGEVKKGEKVASLKARAGLTMRSTRSTKQTLRSTRKQFRSFRAGK